MAKELRISLSNDAFTHLDYLRIQMKKENIADVIRSSVSLLTVLLKEHGQKRKIIIHDKHEDKELILDSVI